jgi:hypothetical protein
MHHVRVIEDLVHEHAEAFVRQFLAPAHRKRMLALVGTEKGFGKFRAALAHDMAHRLDARWAALLAPAQQNADAIGTLLRARHAPGTVVTIGGHQAGDVTGPLGEALQSVVGQAYGALVSCVPGVLAYYESEDCERFLLHQPD